MQDDQLVKVVQKQATVGDIIADHIAGLGGYAIAEKWGLDPEVVKEVIAKANEEGRFIPPGVTPEPEFAGEAPAAAPAPVVEQPAPVVEQPAEAPAPVAEAPAAQEVAPAPEVAQPQVASTENQV